MSSLTIWNNGEILGQLLEDVPNSIEFNDIGVARASLYYSCKWPNAAALVAVVKSHPDFPWLKRTSANVSREEAMLGKVQVDFEGIPPNTEDEDGIKKTYSLEGATSTEPIETHPKFKDFGGDVENPNLVNGARFVKDGDDRGRFLGFTYLIKNGDVNPKAGIKSYLEPALTYVETRLYDSIAAQSIGIEMNNLGEINVPPTSKILPEINTTRSWLLTSCVASTIGDGIQVVRKWRLSGKNGWDEDLYEPLAPA